MNSTIQRFPEISKKSNSRETLQRQLPLPPVPPVCLPAVGSTAAPQPRPLGRARVPRGQRQEGLPVGAELQRQRPPVQLPRTARQRERRQLQRRRPAAEVHPALAWPRRQGPPPPESDPTPRHPSWQAGSGRSVGWLAQESVTPVPEPEFEPKIC